jgi:hypothetical protein
MAHFKERTGNKSAFWYFRNPFPDVAAFDIIVRSLVLKNPLGCMPYMKAGRNHPPVEKVREMYTAKFVYEDAEGKQVGNGLDMYTSVEGYQYGIAAVITNMANVAAHRGKARHVPGSDHFSVTLKCHDPDCGLFFISLSRERLTLSSYEDDELLERVRRWADGVPALEGVPVLPAGRRRMGRPPRQVTVNIPA